MLKVKLLSSAPMSTPIVCGAYQARRNDSEGFLSIRGHRRRRFAGRSCTTGDDGGRRSVDGRGPAECSGVVAVVALDDTGAGRGRLPPRDARTGVTVCLRMVARMSVGADL